MATDKSNLPKTVHFLPKSSSVRTWTWPSLFIAATVLSALNNYRLRYDQDLVVNLKHEKEKMVEICEQEEKQLERMKRVMDTVEMFEVRTASGSTIPLTLEECAEIFRKLQEEFYVEYKMYDLSSLAVAVVFPMVRAS